MASYQHIQHQSRAPFESPAKIFAKLKSKLQRPNAEDFSDDEYRAAVIHGAPSMPKRRTEGHGMHIPGDFSPFHSLSYGGATAVTLSPISSPQKSLQYRTDCELLCAETERAFNHPCISKRRAFMQSTAVCNTTEAQTHMDSFHTRKTNGSVPCEPVDLENAGRPHFISPNSVFSPMRKRLRKTKSDNQPFNTLDMGHTCYPEKERKISPAFREDEHITSTRNVEPFGQEFTVAPEHNGCVVETLPHSLMSPAKIFAYLKERETQRDQWDVPLDTSTPRPEADQDIQIEARVGTDSTSSNVDRLQGPDDCSSDEDFPHVSVADVPPLPVLLEDPVVLNSPRISIPKTQTVCRRTKWSDCITFPTENVIHLSKWFIREARKGLFVDGIHREKNIKWNSNIISERVSNSVLKTVSGRVYILLGKMNLDAPLQFPQWFLKRFVNGFPSNWKELHKKYSSESKGKLSKGSEEQNYKRCQNLKASMNQPVKRQQTSLSCPSSSASSTKVSRSGRLIKPPLDYWKGGRVILDAHMNVTIHDSYDTTVIQPPEQKNLVRVPLDNVCEQLDSIPKHQLQRKVKAPQRKPRQNKGIAIKKPPSPQNTNTTSRVTRSSQKCPATDKNSEDAESQESENTKNNVSKATTVKVTQLSAPSQRSPPSNDSASSRPLASKEKAFKNTKDTCSDKSHMKLRSRSSRSSPSPNSTQESGTHTHKSQKKPLKDVKTQQKRRIKTPSPRTTQAVRHKEAQPNRSRKRTAPIKTFSQENEDEWTEEELRKLHEALSCHPMYTAGYWTKVAMMVGTRSAEECYKRHTSMRTVKTPSKSKRKTKKEPLKEKVISARVGTLRRKQQVRDFLEAMPKEDMDDVFSSAYMQSKRIEVPSMCTSEDHDFSVSDQESLTPKPTGFPEAKTPQCLHITPGMMGSGSKNYDDKYVFQLQKRMKNHYQFNVEKHAKKAKANFTPTASMKKTMRRCGNTENDTFVVWEMFPDKEEAQADSGEEEDFYFSEDD